MRVFVLIMALGVVIGCGDRRNLRPDEAEITAWWIEDVAHGSDRRPEELRLVDASERMGAIAQWAEGSEIRGVHTLPQQLQARRNRHAVITDFARQGLVVLRTHDAMLAPRPGLDPDARALVEPVVDAEDRDRRVIEAIILDRADAPPAMAEELLRQTRHARAELDGQDGITTWQPPTTTTTTTTTPAPTPTPAPPPATAPAAAPSTEP
jgi:hypothetical protein